MSVTIYFTVPTTSIVIEKVRVYESATGQTGAFSFVYETNITNSSTFVTYSSGDPENWYKLSFVDEDGNEGAQSEAVTGESPQLSGSYIEHCDIGDSRVDYLIDCLLTPRIECFRQLCVYRGEQFGYRKNPIKSTWSHWLRFAPIRAWRNTLHVNDETDAGTLNLVDPDLGLFEVDPVLVRGETLYVSYYFDFFPCCVLKSLLEQSMDLVNAYEPATNFKLHNAPRNWDGVIVEQAYVLCVEKLLFCSTLWQPRLIFAEPDSMVSQLESALSGARDRLPTVVPSMKRMPYVSPPTWTYYDAIRMGSGRTSFHGQTVGYGRTRGIKINRWFGR